MDRTITISGTYTPFLLHVSAHMAPWRLVFALVIPFIMLAYVLRLIPRKKLKEINQALMIGPHVRRARLQIGRKSCRERGGQYGENSEGAERSKKTKIKHITS